MNPFQSLTGVIFSSLRIRHGLAASQDVYGFYKGEGPPSIETYPVILPRMLSPTDLQPYKHDSIDASCELRVSELLPPIRKLEKNDNDI